MFFSFYCSISCAHREKEVDGKFSGKAFLVALDQHRPSTSFTTTPKPPVSGVVPTPKPPVSGVVPKAAMSLQPQIRAVVPKAAMS